VAEPVPLLFAKLAFVLVKFAVTAFAMEATVSGVT
jgi:hypothetical protein